MSNSPTLRDLTPPPWLVQPRHPGRLNRATLDELDRRAARAIATDPTGHDPGDEDRSER